MIQLDFGPEWFYLPSIAMDAISLLVVLAIALVALKYYKVDKDRRSYLHLSVAFFFITAAILFKILNNIPVYYNNFIAKDLGTVTTIVESVKQFNLFANVSFSLFVMLNLIGLYLLYNLYESRKNKRTSFIVIYLILVLAYFSTFAYYMFNLTSLILLVFVTAVFIRKCHKNPNRNTKLLAYGFGTLAASSAVFMFILFNPGIYVAAELIQLVGYALLLFALVGILNHGKKKN